ncbi:RrF2 family transcriptional regulator, partial [Candidatus Omnitrophota bacterium]
MKLITRDTDYAVRALCYITKQKKNIVSVTELVRKLRIPRPFLRKILQVLNAKGILESHKGKGGGFVLTRAPKNISLVDLIETFQGSFRLNECFFKKIICPHRKGCSLKKAIDIIERRVITDLKSISIASLIKGDKIYYGKKKNNYS